MGKPKLDLAGLKFNHKVNEIVKKIKPMEGITDCWAVDMAASTDKDVAIVASLVVRTKEDVHRLVEIISGFDCIIKVKFDLGESLIYP